MANPYRHVLIIVFAMFQEVSLFISDCGSFWCFDDFCCIDMCCSDKHETSLIEDSPFFVVGMIVFGTIAGFACLYCICIICGKMCKESGELQPQEPTRNQPVPPPPTAPPLPTVPPLILASDPPPYSEVVDKPYFYPAPVGQPPCYDNIAMEDLSSP